MRVPSNPNAPPAPTQSGAPAQQGPSPEALLMAMAEMAQQRKSTNIEDNRKGMDEQGMQDENARHEAEMIQRRNAMFGQRKR